jgi:WD40 repeat protein
MRHLAIVSLISILSSPAAAQEARVLKMPDGWVGAVAFSADSSLFVAAADRTVHIVDFKEPTRKRVVAGHRDIIAAVAFASKGQLLATGGYDHWARIVDLANGKAHTLDQHGGAVMALAFSPDGKHLATGSIDARVILWDVATGKPAQTLTNHWSWVNAVVFNKEGLLATGSSDNTVRLWRDQPPSPPLRKGGTQEPPPLAKGGWTEIAKFGFQEGEVRSLAFSPDGKTLVAGVRYGTIKIIDVAEQTVVSRKSHAADVWAVAFSPDGKTLASGDGDWDRPGDVRLWDTTSWKEKQVLKTTGEVLSLAYSPDGRHLAAGCWDRTVHLWHTK